MLLSIFEYQFKTTNIMKRNVKAITVNVPNDIYLKKINTTPALKRLFRDTLKVGDNEMNVNHFHFSEIMRMQCSLFSVV